MEQLRQNLSMCEERDQRIIRFRVDDGRDDGDRERRLIVAEPIETNTECTRSLSRPRDA